MAKAPFLAALVLLEGYLQRFIELEGEDGLGRDLDSAALGQHLGERARARPGAGPDGRALAAAGDGADDRAERRAAARVNRGPLVDANAVLAFLGDLIGVNGVGL